MAKPASDPKVEDVLSSVRRLVSGEMPRNERPEAPEAPGALVLTNAQRIESPSSETTPDVPVAPSKSRSLEDRISELEVAVSDTTDDEDFEPDGSEDQALHRPDRIVYTRPVVDADGNARPTSQRLSQIALLDTETSETEGAGDEAAQHVGQFRHEKADAPEANTEPTPDVAPEAPMAVDVPQPKRSAEIKAFSSPDDEIARIEARLNGSPAAEVPKEAAQSTPVSVSEAASTDQIEGTLDESISDDAANDGVEDITLDASDDDWNEETEAEGDAPVDTTPLELGTPLVLPDAETNDAGATDEMDDFEDALSEAVASSIEEVIPEEPIAAAPDETVPAPDENDNLLSDGLAEAATGAVLSEMMTEEILQPLVAKLIREELQGELGERITRNVRKLVRREILRAMTTREIE